MGIFSRLGRERLNVLSTPVDIVSPWSEGSSLQQVSQSEIFGAEFVNAAPLSRHEALTIPAVSKAHNLIVTHIARSPLTAYQGPLELVDQPTWLYRSDSGISPFERMSRTVSDLFFEGRALWLVERGTAGQILDAQWVPLSKWTITGDGEIRVDLEPVDESQIILFYPTFEGLLNVATRTLRQARDIENAVAAKVRNPIPLIALSSDEDLQQFEVDQLLADWSKARRDIEGGVAYLPKGITMEPHGEIDPALYLEARNAIRTDIGSFVNVRSAMLDGTSSVDSLTYVTAEGSKNSFFEIDLPFFLDPIAARLSLDDVVPRGTRVAFKLYQSAPPITGIPTGD